MGAKFAIVDGMTKRPLIPAHSPLRRLRAQPRFRQGSLTILVPQNDYYVQNECCRALSALGHQVVRVPLGKGGEVLPIGELLRVLLQATLHHRPDMLLTINYTGFDRAGYFDEVVEAMGLPTAVWFVDSPFFLAEGYLQPGATMVSLFAWDRSYVPVLRAHGAPDVHHLPLAACRDTFCMGAPPPAEPPLPVTFVGHSLDILVSRWRGLLSDEAAARAQQCCQALTQERAVLHALHGSVGAPLDARVREVALGNYLASRALRQRYLAALPREQLHVFGDPAWQRLLPNVPLHGTTAYGPETRRIYQHGAINVNVTNLQMPETVNQRVFDVPACGAFLLTDRQAELSALFEEDGEVVAFDSPAELADKAAYYARRPSVRRAIAARAKTRVLAEHTYAHRMARLVTLMRSKHGPARAPKHRTTTCDAPPTMS